MTSVKLGSVPDITNNQVQVITVSQNLSTEDIEQYVTYPVELAMANLPGVKEIRSVSRFGLSVVTIVFEDDMGTYLPRQLIDEKLEKVKKDIPEGFGEPFIGPITTGLGEIYQYTIEPKPGYDTTYSLTELRTFQDWIVRRQMAMVKGVVDVNSFGGKIKQYEVAIDPNRLNSMGVTISEVFNALKRNNSNTGGAYIEKNHKAQFIRGEGLAQSLDDLRKVVVKNAGGTPILVSDVADTVRYDNQIRYGAFTKDGSEAVGGMVFMLRGANPNAVIQRVKKRMETIETSLPEGLEIRPFLDRSELIGRTTSTVATNLTEGALIVIFVLVILLGTFRGGLITASIIPLSLLFAFIMMRAFDVWANLMSLGAIDFGIIVDGSVIIVEGVVYKVEQSLRQNKVIDRKGMDELATSTSSEMMRSAFFGQLIILLVFAPILFLTGVEGKMFRPMAYTFGFALIGAIMLCLTYVPAVSAILLKPAQDGSKSVFQKIEDRLHRLSTWIMNGIYRFYQPILHKALQLKTLVIVLALMLLGSSIYTFSRMGGEFLPQLDEGDISMHIILQPGSSLSESIEQAKKVENILLDKFPEVKTALTRFGVADIPTDPMPMDIGDVFIILEKDKSKWESADTKEELIGKIKEELSVLPGLTFPFTQPIEMRFNALLTGIRQDVAVKLYGDDLDVLSNKAQEMASIIRGVDGAADIHVEATTGLPQMTINYNRGKLAQYGLDIAKLNNYVETAFAGGKAGVVFEGEKRFDMVVRLTEEHRQDINSLQQLLIDLPNGNQIPLKELADISYKPGPMQISRENTHRRTYVGINVRGRDVESLVKDVQQKLDNELTLPPGYYLEYGGAFKNLQRATNRLLFVVPIALALIFILLFFALRSITQSVMIFMAVPLAAIGGVYTLFIRDMPFSISAGVGFVVLFGVAVLNGLILINRFNSLKSEGVTNLKERIMKGTQERMRPILLTATSTIAGFVPMAFSTSAGAEVQQPLATVVIGGLVTATILTLVVLPVLYALVEKRKMNSTSGMANASSFLVLLGTTAILSMFLLQPGRATAQDADADASKTMQRLNLQQAIEIAKERYPAIQKAQSQVKAQEALKKTSLDLGTTGLYMGQSETSSDIDGVRTYGIRQTGIDPFSAPSKAKLQKRKVSHKRAALKLTEQQLVRAVRKAYYKLFHARSRLELANRLDSIYRNFEESAQLRYETEATDKLELLSARNRYRQVQVMRQQAEDDRKIARLALKRWLNRQDTLILQDTSSYRARPIPALDTSAINSHPLINVKKQNIKIKEAEVKARKAEFMPQINGTYGRQTVQGEAGFYTFRAGISLPLWFVPQQGRVQEAKAMRETARFELKETQLELTSRLRQKWQDYQKARKTLTYYDEYALPLSEEQIAAAQESYQAGEIDYNEYVQNLDDALQIQREYLHYLNQYNQHNAELRYMMGL